MIGKKIWLKLLSSLFLFSLCFLLASLPILAAAPIGDLDLYYGDTPNVYTQYNSDGSSVTFYYPYYVGACLVAFNDATYLCFFCRDHWLIQNGDVLGVYRNRIYRNPSGSVIQIDKDNFFQFSGYNSTRVETIEDSTFYFRSMKVSDTVITGVPFFTVDTPYSHDDYLPYIFITMESILKYREKASINGDINVDLGSISDDVTFIKANTDEIVSAMNIDSEDITVIKVYLSLCFVILSATLFRNIFSQWLRNTVR